MTPTWTPPRRTDRRRAGPAFPGGKNRIALEKRRSPRRGDHRPDSDWDLLAILPDDAPEEALDPVRVWEVRRRSGLHADLFVVTRSEFLDAQGSVTTLSAIVARKGVTLFPERVTFG